MVCEQKYVEMRMKLENRLLQRDYIGVSEMQVFSQMFLSTKKKELHF